MEETNDNGNGRGTALAVVQRQPLSSTYEPRDIGEGITLAEHLAASGLLGRNLDTPGKVFAIVVAGRELGLPAMTSLRSIHLVEGKPVMAADTIVGLVRASGLCASFQLVEGTDRVATYEAKRADTGDTGRMTFTWDDATRAGLANKDNWRKYPATMLRHRAAAMLARELFPDVVLNVYEQNEADEIRGTFAPAQVVETPRQVVKPAALVPTGAVVTERKPRESAPAPSAAPAPRTTTLPGGSTVKVNGGPKAAAPTTAGEPPDFVMQVGKHKGVKASEVPVGYLEWYADAKESDPSKWEGKAWEQRTRDEIAYCRYRSTRHEEEKAQAAPPADDGPPPPDAPGEFDDDSRVPF